MKYFHLLFLLLLISCDWAKEKTKETVNKTGEIVAKTGSEFANGISKGVQQTFAAKAQISDTLLKEGLTTGKIILRGTDTSENNIVSVYFIFDKNFDKKITIKAFNESGLECGRVAETVKGKKDEARYVDFVFDKRTSVDAKGKLVIE